jgi:hypothetical protein
MVVETSSRLIAVAIEYVKIVLIAWTLRSNHYFKAYSNATGFAAVMGTALYSGW